MLLRWTPQAAGFRPRQGGILTKTATVVTTSLALLLALAPLISALPPPSFPQGHVTIHKWPSGVPTILVLPPSWDCDKIVSGSPSPANLGDALPNSGDSVVCTPPPDRTQPFCQQVGTLGYAAGLGSGGLVTVTSACRGIATSSTFVTPGGTDADVAFGFGFFPWECSVSWTKINELDDWWAHCDVNALTPGFGPDRP